MNSKPVLEVKNLSVYHRNSKKTILDALTFSVMNNEVLGIVGESGSGKSMTALSILNILPEGIIFGGGEIIFEDRDISGFNNETMRAVRGHKISMIFQEPSTYLNPVLTVGFQMKESSGNRAKALELLHKTGLPCPEETILKYPFQLSGGQKQRVMTAMAVASRPKILIADEPTTSLDVTVQAQVLELLKRIKKETESALVFITHDFAVINRIADRVLVMYRGKIVEQGEKERLFAAPRHPYTVQLLESAGLLKKGWVKKELQKKIPGEPLLKTEALRVFFPVKKGLLKRTKGYVRAVDGVSLEVGKRETVGLIGESGCGKSTLGRALLKLIPVSGGRIVFKGRELKSKGFSRGLAMAFQDPYSSLNPKLNIKDIVGEGLKVYKKDLTSGEREKIISETLSLVQLPEKILSKYPHQFSGGERQRIALARVLAMEPEIIVLDEVTSSLDVTVKAQIQELLREIQHKKGISYLYISHDLPGIREMASRVYVMYLGKIVEQGAAEELFLNPQHPYTKLLLSSSPDPSSAVIPVYPASLRFSEAEQERGGAGSYAEKQSICSGDVPDPSNPPSGCHFHPRCVYAKNRCRAEYPDEIFLSDGRSISCFEIDNGKN